MKMENDVQLMMTFLCRGKVADRGNPLFASLLDFKYEFDIKNDIDLDISCCKERKTTKLLCWNFSFWIVVPLYLNIHYHQQ